MTSSSCGGDGIVSGEHFCAVASQHHLWRGSRSVPPFLPFDGLRVLGCPDSGSTVSSSLGHEIASARSATTLFNLWPWGLGIPVLLQCHTTLLAHPNHPTIVPSLEEISSLFVPSFLSAPPRPRTIDLIRFASVSSIAIIHIPSRCALSSIGISRSSLWISHQDISSSVYLIHPTLVVVSSLISLPSSCVILLHCSSPLPFRSPSSAIYLRSRPSTLAIRVIAIYPSASCKLLHPRQSPCC